MASPAVHVFHNNGSSHYAPPHASRVVRLSGFSLFLNLLPFSINPVLWYNVKLLFRGFVGRIDSTICVFPFVIFRQRAGIKCVCYRKYSILSSTNRNVYNGLCKRSYKRDISHTKNEKIKEKIPFKYSPKTAPNLLILNR